MKKMLIVLACLLFAAGCAGMKTTQVVHENTLHSSFAPRMNITVHPDMKFIGEFNEPTFGTSVSDPLSTTRVDRKAWVFAQTSIRGNATLYMERGVIIEAHQLPANSNWSYDASSLLDIENKVLEGVESILGKDYKWAVVAPYHPFVEEMRTMLIKKGYYPCYPAVVRMAVRKMSQRSVVYCVYFESVQRNRSLFFKPNVFSRDLKPKPAFTEDFLERSAQAMTFEEFSLVGLPPELGGVPDPCECSEPVGNPKE